MAFFVFIASRKALCIEPVKLDERRRGTGVLEYSIRKPNRDKNRRQEPGGRLDEPLWPRIVILIE